MSFSDVHPGDPIIAANVQQVIDALKGTSGKGIPLAVSAVNDSARYALTLENTEATNSRALNVLKNDGSVLIRADATGVTLGQPLNLPTGSVTSTAIADGTIATADLANQAVTNVKLGTDTARLNLLTNGGFEIWQRGTSFATTGAYTADRWVMTVAGTDAFSVNKNTANADTANGSLTCAWLSYSLGSGGGSYVSQTLRHSDGPALNGRTVTFSARVNTSLANAIRLGVGSDAGGTTVYSAYHPGGSTYQTLSVTFTVPVAATFTQPTIFVSAGTTQAFYVDNAMLVVGSVAADYAPLHPADDLARCLRYFERIAPGAANAPIAIGQLFNTITAICATALKARKAVVPTVTVSAASDFQITNAAYTPTGLSSLTPYTGSVDTLALQAAASAGISTAGFATVLSPSNSNGWVSVEA